MIMMVRRHETPLNLLIIKLLYSKCWKKRVAKMCVNVLGNCSEKC